MILKPIIDKRSYWLPIFKEIDSFMCGLFFDVPFDILGIELNNANGALQNAILQGKIEYTNGYMWIVDKRIPNAVAKEIEDMGGKFNKAKKAYKLPMKNIDVKTQYAIAQAKLANKQKIEEVQRYFKNLGTNIEYALDSFNVVKPVEDMQDDLFGQLKQSLVKINVIPYEKTPSIVKALSENYTNNIKYYIKNFSLKELPKMRKGIQEIVEQGYRASAVKKYLIKRYGITERKAKFLAEQETRLFVAEYRKAQFKENGVSMYIWSSMEDDRVRPLHAQLNDTVQSWDNPPISEDDGSRNNAGEAFGCYEKTTEVLTKDGFKLVKDVKIGETIATLNPKTKAFEWSVCSNRVEKKVKEIANIKNNIFDLSVSLDHTFFYYSRKYLNRTLVLGSEEPVFSVGIDSLKRKNTRFYASSENWQGDRIDSIFGIPTDIFCKFMGYYLSDGNVDKRSKNCIHIANRDNQAMYDELKPYLHICQGKEKLFIYNKDLYNVVAPLGLCYDKRVPEAIKKLDKEHIRTFLDAFASCDGQKARMVKGFDRKKEVVQLNQYYTSSPKMMSDLIECIYKTGSSASVYIAKTKGKEQKFNNGVYTINYDIYTINEMRTKWRDLASMRVDIKPYDDFVYDIEVKKNHTILIKSGKSIHWNSNCRCIALPYVPDEDLYPNTSYLRKEQKSAIKEKEE